MRAGDGVPAPVRIAAAEPADATELAGVAAATFPLACPESVSAADISAFVAATLTAQCFRGYLTDPGRLVLTASASGRIVGYAMLVRAEPADSEIELSKIYLLPSHHRSGVAAELLTAGIDWAAERGARAVWLGVNRGNLRAQRFYRKHGFAVSGTRTFRLGASVQGDLVMRRGIGGDR